MVPTSSQDEALARDGVSREVPCSALKGETVPDSLHQTQVSLVPGTLAFKCPIPQALWGPWHTGQGQGEDF